MKTLTEESIIRLKKILSLSNKLNTGSKKIIEMIGHHAEEIKALYKCQKFSSSLELVAEN